MSTEETGDANHNTLLASGSHVEPESSRPQPNGSDNKPYSCEKCQTTFTEKDNLKRHVQKKSCVFHYICKECGQGFKKQKSLKIHCYKHTGVLPLACPKCDKRFLMPSNLKRHEKTHEIKVHKCDKSSCGEEFSSWSQYRKHVAQAHRVFSVNCPHCEKKFQFAYELKKHIRVHEKDLPCGVSGCKELIPRWRMKRHINEAHPSKDTRTELLAMFACGACGKSFDRCGKLERHLETHDKPSTSRSQGASKEFVCPAEGCGKSFSRQYKLSYHMNVHEKKKPFKCPEGASCGKRSYCSRQSLKVHLLEFHGIDLKLADVCKALVGSAIEPSDSEMSSCGESARRAADQTDAASVKVEVA